MERVDASAADVAAHVKKPDDAVHAFEMMRALRARFV
jgi:hypothetical protein